MFTSVLFTIFTSVFGMLISIPFKLYLTFVIEEKYGFNKTTSRTFICDQLKSLMLTVIFTSLLLPLILWVVDIAGDMLVVSLAGVSLSLIILIQLLVPTCIIPLFYKFSDLVEGTLKTDIFKESEKTKIPVS